MSERFLELFDNWLDGGKADKQIRRQLIDSMRASWNGGDREDQYAIVDFVRLANLTEGFDLLAEGIASLDAGLATHAVANSLFLASHGARLDPRTVPALREFGLRVPDKKVLSESALRRISET